MFSLIITIIAIALVAALALATLYYGGPVFNEGSERALAAKLDAQGQQIMGALELYNAENGHYPASLNDLVSTNYLRAIPTAAAEQAVMAAAYAATGTWTLSSPGQPVIVMKPVSLATCQAFNKTNIGVAGVLQQAHSTKLKQCIGTDVNNLMIVQPKAASDLIFVSTDPAAVVQIGAVLSTPVPAVTDTTSNGWLNTSGAPAQTSSVSYSGSGAFGDVTVGQTSAPSLITVTNSGTASLTFGVSSGLASAPFSVVANTCDNVTLAPAASCTVSLAFIPTIAGAFSGGSYTFNMVAAGGALNAMPLSGTGIAAPTGPANVVAYFDSESGDPLNGTLNMAPVPANMSKPEYFINVKNVSADPIVFPNSYPGTTATMNDPFFVTYDGCSDMIIAPGDYCTMAVQFWVPGGAPFTSEGGVGSYSGTFVPVSTSVSNINSLTINATATTNVEF